MYVEVRERGDAILQLLSGGQWVIAPIIQQLAEQIEFDAPTGLARRWYPMGRSGLIVRSDDLLWPPNDLRPRRLRLRTFMTSMLVRDAKCGLSGIGLRSPTRKLRRR